MSGTPWLFRMRWVDLLFMHRPVPADALRPLIPPGLELDTFEGRAWLGVVPFGMQDVAPRFLPAPPGPGAFPELNVRTYVRRRGRGGVWFLSLDAGSRLAVEGARAAFHLPYYQASMSSTTEAGWVEYCSERNDPRGQQAASPAGIGRSGRRRLRHAALSPRSSPTVLACMPWTGPGGCHGPRSATRPGRSSRRRPRSSATRWPPRTGIELRAEAPLLHFAKRLDVVAWLPRRIRTGASLPERPLRARRPRRSRPGGSAGARSHSGCHRARRDGRSAGTAPTERPTPPRPIKPCNGPRPGAQRLARRPRDRSAAPTRRSSPSSRRAARSSTTSGRLAESTGPTAHRAHFSDEPGRRRPQRHLP